MALADGRPAKCGAREFLLLTYLERGIPPSDSQHPKDFSPRERSDERGEMAQRSVGGADLSCDRGG